MYTNRRNSPMHGRAHPHGEKNKLVMLKKIYTIYTAMDNISVAAGNIFIGASHFVLCSLFYFVCVRDRVYFFFNDNKQ